MERETYDDPAAFAAAVRRAQRAASKAKCPKDERPALPSAGRDEAIGLTPLLVAGWCSSYVVGLGYRMTRGALDTGYHASERAMCSAAKALGKE